ncbi:hypothetical protein QQ045_006856 [Rhodiola kirilowii]
MAFIQRNTFGFGILFFLLSIFILINHATSFDITKMLSQQQDFSSFSNLLTQTQVASQINSRQTITVLALDNSAVSQISGKPRDVLKKILEVHVILDYYDVQKLQKLSNKTALLTTLFQASGQANGQQGFVNVTDTESGTVAFGSAVAGSSLNANLVKSVVSQPYNISVLQISSPILPPGIEGSSKSAGTAQLSTPPTGAPPPTSTTPSPSTSAPPQKSKTPTPSSAPSASDDGSTPPTSADAPTVSSPASAPSDAPVGSPLADGPIAADGPAAETTADSSDGGRLGGGFGIFIISTLLIDIGMLV